MTPVPCPYCGLPVVRIGADPGEDLPRLRDGFIGEDGRVLGLRRGSHGCTGYHQAVRIYDLAGADS